MQFSKTIFLPEWSEAVEQKLRSFWTERGMVFSDWQGEVLTGKRGSLWGNLTSFDMSKLLTTLTIARSTSTQISCTLRINTVGQAITEWNKAYWELELDTLQSWLLHDDRRKAEWEKYLADSRTAAALWSASLGILGRKLPRQ